MPYAKEKFLSNTKNKKGLISLLATNLKNVGHYVYICTGDADTKIISKALDESKEKEVADDIDVAVMLLYNWNTNLLDIRFNTERDKNVGA